MTKTALNSSTCILILIFAVLGVYYPAIFAPLNSVDDVGMHQYLLNTEEFTWQGIFLSGGGSYYRPVLLLSFMPDKYLWGLAESFMHLENILFHLANTLMVYAIARRVARLRDCEGALAPFTAAFFFAVHPLNTEAVNWISGRTDLLAGFFLLLCVWVLMRRPLHAGASLLAAASLFLACLAKETAIFFLPAALILPFFSFRTASGREPVFETLRRNIPHFLIFATAGFAYFRLRLFALSGADTGVATVVSHVAGGDGPDALLRMKLLVKALGFYAKKLLQPFPLNFGIIQVSDAYILLGVLVVALICWLLLRRTLTAFFFVSAAAIACSALMIPLLRMTWTPVAERYMYIPSALFVIGIMLAAQSWEFTERRRTWVTVCAGLIAMIALYGTAERTLLWQDNLALFQDTLRKSPGFAPAKNEMANALYQNGDRDRALAMFKSFDGGGDLVNAQYGHTNKAFALTREGNFSEARAVLRKTLEHPGKHEIMILKQMLEVNKSEMMQSGKMSPEVYQDYVQVLSRLIERTGDPFFQYRLGVVQMQGGHPEKALALFEAAAKRAPREAYYQPAAEKLAAKLAQTSQTASAMEK